MRRKHRSLEERLRLYEEVMKLRRLGLGYERIAKAIKEKYGVWLSPAMIGKWITGKHHSLGSCNKLVVAAELAYVIGGWLGDGWLRYVRNNHRYCVGLSVRDYDFAEEWGRCLALALGRRQPYKPYWDKYHQRWVVEGYSLLLYTLLRRSEKNLRILMPILEKHPAEACRGFFDAEGTVDVDYYYIAASNTNPKLIELFKNLLRKIGIESKIYRCRQKEVFIDSKTGKLYHRNSKYIIILTISREGNILRYAERVSFIVARKRLKLMKLLGKYLKADN